MSKHDTGGPAFPVTFQHDDSSSGCTAEIMGMDLRDYFAAKAMQGICAHPDTWGFTIPSVATRAYEMADAMLKARQS